ncbi:MAG: hypothetical protein ACRDRL_10470 [Sciscionella sp.]
MPWFKVDDSFYDHPKIFDAPDCAVALWTRAGAWSARNLTDGFVPAKLPARLCDDPDTAIGQLVDRGVWRRTKAGYQFHDWSEYQPTAETVRDLRQKRADAGRKGGLAGKTGKQNGSKTQASASHFAKQNGTPSRPVLSSGYLEGVSPDSTAREKRPPDKCSKHENDPDPPNCRACADTRRAAETFDEHQRMATVMTARACPRCDTDGWRFAPGRRVVATPYVKCDHQREAS